MASVALVAELRALSTRRTRERTDLALSLVDWFHDWDLPRGRLALEFRTDSRRIRESGNRFDGGPDTTGLTLPAKKTVTAVSATPRRKNVVEARCALRGSKTG